MVDIGIHSRRQGWLLSRQAWKLEKTYQRQHRLRNHGQDKGFRVRACFHMLILLAVSCVRQTNITGNVWSTLVGTRGHG